MIKGYVLPLIWRLSMENNKIFIFHLMKTDSNNLPCGKYFIDNETNKLYVSPVDEEKAEKHEKATARVSQAFIPLATAVGVFYGDSITARLVQNTMLGNISLLFVCIGVFLALFSWVKKRDLRARSELVKEAGYQLIECEKAEEIEFLEGLAKKSVRIIAICILSFIAMCVFGYITISFTRLLFLFFMLFLMFAGVFATFFVNLRIILPALVSTKNRIKILKERA